MRTTTLFVCAYALLCTCKCNVYVLKCVQTHVSKLHLTRLCVGCIYMGGRMCICNFVDIGGYFGNIKFPSSLVVMGIVPFRERWDE